MDWRSDAHPAGADLIEIKMDSQLEKSIRDTWEYHRHGIIAEHDWYNKPILRLPVPPMQCWRLQDQLQRVPSTSYHEYRAVPLTKTHGDEVLRRIDFMSDGIKVDEWHLPSRRRKSIKLS